MPRIVPVAQLAQELCSFLNRHRGGDTAELVKEFATGKSRLGKGTISLATPEETRERGITKAMTVHLDAHKFLLYFHGVREEWTMHATEPEE